MSDACPVGIVRSGVSDRETAGRFRQQRVELGTWRARVSAARANGTRPTTSEPEVRISRLLLAALPVLALFPCGCTEPEVYGIAFDLDGRAQSTVSVSEESTLKTLGWCS